MATGVGAEKLWIQTSCKPGDDGLYRLFPPKNVFTL